MFSTDGPACPTPECHIKWLLNGSSIDKFEKSRKSFSRHLHLGACGVKTRWDASDDERKRTDIYEIQLTPARGFVVSGKVTSEDMQPLTSLPIWSSKCAQLIDEHRGKDCIFVLCVVDKTLDMEGAKGQNVLACALGLIRDGLDPGNWFS